MFLEVPGHGLLPYEENENLDLAVPVLGGTTFCLHDLTREGLGEPRHFVSFCRKRRDNNCHHIL